MPLKLFRFIWIRIEGCKLAVPAVLMRILWTVNRVTLKLSRSVVLVVIEQCQKILLVKNASTDT